MPSPASRWSDLYNQTPLCDVPRHYAGISASPFLLDYLTEVLRLCPRGGRTLETGIGSGYGAVWLSERGLQAEGLDYAPFIVERARLVNNILQGRALFRVGDLFDLFAPEALRYNVIHHQGVLEHFNAHQVRAALAQQVALCDHVVFSVPSVYYPFDPEFGDERLLPIEEWQRLLEPFDVAELRYYGDTRLGGQEQILGVLSGQAATPDLLALMHPGEEPYPGGVSAIVHTRNEARHIAACLETLTGWTDEVIVCDMESTDGTPDIALRYTDKVVHHPLIPNFDRARNASAMRASFRWVFYLDADERVPPGLGASLRNLILQPDPPFEALLIPFRHHFAGQWMRCLYPGYTAPRLLKNGRFHFNPRLHSGAVVDGRVLLFPANDPGLALEHFSFDNLSHYLDKLNRYTDGEAGNLHRDGAPFHWQNAIRHFVTDFQSYYDRGGASQDGVHGFLYSFLSGFYRFEQHAKLYELRTRHGQVQVPEQQVPASVEEVLEFALTVARQKAAPAVSDIRVEPNGVPTVWCGPLLDPSGYGEESRHLLFALEEAIGEEATGGIGAQAIPWGDREAPLNTEERRRLQVLTERAAAPGVLQIIHNFAPAFRRHPQAGITVGRTMFETDRLPADWVKACNRMDAVWVPSEFNRGTFVRAGVDEDLLMVVPECLDPAPYEAVRDWKGNPFGLPQPVQDAATSGAFVFLTIFDWTLHKGWDVLLRAFFEEFDDDPGVALLLKVWSTLGHSKEGIIAQASAFVRDTIGRDLVADGRVRFLFDHVDQPGLIGIYGASDAYVMPSRGEGWGRPYMEAMACGLPVIGTNWSGNTAFMTPETSYLLDYDLVDVPEHGWREVPTYRGHRWAEPRVPHLRDQMRRVFTDRGEARAVGDRARRHISENFSRKAIGPHIKAVVGRVHALHSRRSFAVPQETVCVPLNDGKPDSLLVRVRWEGPQFNWHSLAHVNREICKRLLNEPKVELSVLPTEPAQFEPDEVPGGARLAERAFAALGDLTDVHVRHFFPPRLAPADEGHLVLVQPWEYGYLPTEWIDPIRATVSEVWCYSNYVRDVYRNSGIDDAQLRLIPLGVDTSVFNPDAPPYVFTNEAGTRELSGSIKNRFVFLYVGGTTHRKGADILLEAYLRAFSPQDEVVLVVKDTGTQTVYRDQNEGTHIRALITDPTRPRIVYLDGDLSAHQLAGVFAVADCLVQPYRGEGFCLPVLEAMACGTPAIVPAGGPTDDFVDERVGWRIPAEHRPFGDGRIGPWTCIQQPWMFEVDPDDLARLMRRVREQSHVAKDKGQESANLFTDAWTWKHTAKAVMDRLQALGASSIPRARLHQGTAHVIQPEPMSDVDAANVAARTATGHAVSSAVPAAPPVVSTSQAATIAFSAHLNRRHPTISLCMIVRNEERVLGECLASAMPWVDEAIVVDTGSTDRTVEIARQHGARVEHFEWCDDFSAARNASLSYATGDWILWIDADDTLAPSSGMQLHDLLLRALDKTTGIIMQVHIPPGPGQVGFTVVDHVKLFRNGLGLQFEGRIHEQILEPIYRTGGSIERSHLFVTHSGYDHSPEGQARKRERDLRLLEKDLQERPDHPFVLFNIGMTAYHMGDFQKGREALERCLAVSKPQELTIRKVYAMLAGCHLEEGDIPRAQGRVQQGLELYPNDPELLFRAGIIYHRAGLLREAEESYLKLMTEREEGHIDSLDVTMAGFKAHHNLALVYEDMGRPGDAEKQWQLAVGLEPNFTPSWLGLGELYSRVGNASGLAGVLECLEQLDPGQAEWFRQRLRQMSGERTYWR